MDRRDQELLAKQLRTVTGPPRSSAVIGLAMVAALLVGIGVGNILSKSKRASADYAAVISRITGGSG